MNTNDHPPFDTSVLPKATRGHIRYPYPWPRISALARDVLILRPRWFREDACAFVAALEPPPRVFGSENVPSSGPCLLTINHYYRPGFRAWWLTLGVSAVVPADVHWVVTAAWTFPNRPHLKPLRSATEWAFRRVARVYGFTSMPPMPPDPSEVAERARAVRLALAHARRTPRPVIALAPEGGDSPDGRLRMPAPGVGRFIVQLARLGLEMVPVGVYEAGGEFCLRFGSRYRLDTPGGLSPDELDRRVRQTAMARIAALLPNELRGEFG